MWGVATDGTRTSNIATEHFLCWAIPVNHVLLAAHVEAHVRTYLDIACLRSLPVC